MTQGGAGARGHAADDVVQQLYGELDGSRHVGGRDCLHPNAAGRAEIADVLHATLAR